jgi:hypothetical protein
MKTVQHKAFLLLILVATFLPAFSQTGRVVDLFADRDFAVSGDTVWYKTVINKIQRVRRAILYMFSLRVITTSLLLQLPEKVSMAGQKGTSLCPIH